MGVLKVWDEVAQEWVPVQPLSFDQAAIIDAVTASTQTMEFVQSTASDTWVLEHTFPNLPDVTTISDDGDVVYGTIHHDSSIQVTVTFSSPVRGIAYLRP